MKDYVKDLYQKLSESRGETPEECYYDYFKLEDGELYYRGKRKPLTTKGLLKPVGMLADILDKGGLRNLGFVIPRGESNYSAGSNDEQNPRRDTFCI